ncbi:MAG: zinc ribbon domain-containing protein [Candidatus Dadabacteria bacterium]|nr:zinc ribbon domain-containing protein [Candidatus Dadabacteria bacterium]NIS08547.1 zinc ribbon domain-containing protein [Candidatus Dadabacteria bacterium]NIV41375.1 zinc ribbon domain-containing protein [Candidatus Dadabacteria bacterium]NIX14582.1 zinc ribbon domain-containing protein [Candidatus Dadabacteria bacterium]NIY21037.1 zinc ribbon domain-containing protein [Candidatus Dadabacteria bacterium]
MPIYEYYCKKCNTIYQFFSRTINTDTFPKCPSCKRPKLERIMSGFATISDSGDEADTGMDMPDIDEAKIQKAMALIEKNMAKVDVNEEDPRQAAQLMRDLTSITGLEMGDGMEEALSRLESGEDPDKIEQEMGDLLKEDDQLYKKSNKGKKRKASRPKPKKDDTLYELE